MSIEAMKQALEADKAFEKWWDEEGSTAPKHRLDCEEHCYQIAKIAWSNGAYKARTAIEQAEFEAAHEALEKQAGIHVSQQSAEKQEPVAWADMDVRGEDKGLSWTPGHFHTQPLYTTPPAAPVQERNFCERCGKRLGDGHIHTCTPPETQRQWVGLTEEEMQQTCYEAFSYDPYVIARAIEAKLREKNGGQA